MEHTALRQIRAHGVVVGYVEIVPHATVCMVAKCTDDILDAVRGVVEKEIGAPAGPFTPAPQMVDDERERVESYATDDDEPGPGLWLPEGVY